MTGRIENDEELLSSLREEIGDLQFFRFANATRYNSRLLYWQERVLEKFNSARETNFSLRFDEVRRLMDTVILPAFPQVHRLPDWCGLDSLDGECPVQATGTLSTGHSWYFRARWSDIQISVAKPGINPIDVFSTVDGNYFHDEEYGVEKYDASYMDFGEARHFILKHLSIACDVLGLPPVNPSSVVRVE